MPVTPYNYPMHFLNSPTTKKTLLLAILTIIAYGLLLPFTGFYWDDWPFAWIANFLGSAEFIPAFIPFRPFLGPIFYATTSIIPTHPLAWQIFALLIRFLIGLSAWWMFTQIFPNRKTLAFLASLLMLVYPGYSQHWVALTHINQELIPFLFYLLSFGYTFKALHTKKRTDTLIALLLQLCGLFPTEYFFGIEGLRFLLLLTTLPGTLLQRFSKTLKVWLPYLLIWVLNAAWLYYYYKFGPYASYELTPEATTPYYFLTQALDALWKAGIYIWIQVLIHTFSSLTAPASILTLGLIAISVVLITPILLRLAQNTSSETQDTSLAIYLIFTGLIGILLGRLPSLAANLPLNLQSSYDRFMISMMIGSITFILGLLELLIKKHQTRILLISILIALGTGQQFFNANIFRRDWQHQGEILWELSYRIPNLTPNTTLLAHQMPLDYETDLNLTAAINWMYAPNYTKSNIPHMLLYTEKRLGGTTLPSLAEDTPIYYPYRTVDFNGSTSQALVLYKEQGCLRVLDPSRGHTKLYENISEEFPKAVALSNPTFIITTPPNQQRSLPAFVPEPKTNWCTYFEKIELANQTGNHAQAANLASEAQALQLSPTDPMEWTAIIEAYALSGEIEKAVEISKIAQKAERKMIKGVCLTWEQVQAQSLAGSAKEEIEAARLSLGCNP